MFESYLVYERDGLPCRPSMAVLIMLRFSFVRNPKKVVFLLIQKKNILLK